MKKVFALLSIVAMFSMVACGPSDKEKEEAELKRVQDSTNTADSTLAAQQLMDAEMQRQADSAAAADTSMKAPAEDMEHEGHN